MGGFLYNGCGAADTYKKMRFLKKEICPSCRKEREFYLAKIRMKIHIAFIPTIPINTKYGIICSKCKSGYYVSESIMYKLMAADEADLPQLFDAIMKECSNAEMIAAQPDAKEEQPATKAIASGKCPQCGQSMEADELFCGHCGHRMEAKQPETGAIEGKKCPQCGQRMEADELFCGHCGHRMEPSVSVQEEPAQNVAEETPETPVQERETGNGAWVCPLCNTENTTDEDTCQLCGHTR